MEVIFLFWIAFIVLTAIAAHGRGRSVGGWLLLAIPFGLFALLAVLVLGKKEPTARQISNPSGPSAGRGYSDTVGRF
jgi:hypothetical protein